MNICVIKKLTLSRRKAWRGESDGAEKTDLKIRGD